MRTVGVIIIPGYKGELYHSYIKKFDLNYLIIDNIPSLNQSQIIPISREKIHFSCSCGLCSECWKSLEFITGICNPSAGIFGPSASILCKTILMWNIPGCIFCAGLAA
jgi:hypothetical protein